MNPPVFSSVLTGSFLLTLVAPSLGAADWPQWRGPQRDGHSRETGLLREWPKDGPKLLWQVKAIGSGYSTPAVVGERIFLLSNEGLENEFVLALSTKDGSRVWQTKLGKVGHPEQNPKYPAARSTPTVDGARLFALGSDGDLVCLNTSEGKEIWRKHLRTDFGGRYGEWAYSESPLVDGDRLVVTPGGSNATLVALNKHTGEVIWKCALPQGDEASYASVITTELGGVKQYVQFFTNGLTGVEAATGKLLWRYPRSARGSPAIVVTPIASDDFIYSGAFRAGGALVRPTRQGDGFTVEELYFNSKLPVGLGGVVKVGDYFYGSSGQTVMCVEFKTGAIKWEERALGPSSWLAADGRLYLHGENGEVALLEPTPEAYREKGRFAPPDRPSQQGGAKAWAYPVLADGRLYIREGNSLWCYDVKAAR